MNVFGLYPLPGVETRPEGVLAVLNRLSRPGVTLLCREKARSFAAAFPQVRPVPEEDFWTEAQCILALGGDGTILAAAPEAARRGKPVFGVNLGHVGFLTACAPGEGEKLDLLLADQVIPSRRMMLSLLINGEEKAAALNEILLASRARAKVLSGVLSVNGKKLMPFRADALLFHTPTGSTGYAFSAGGAVCSEGLDLIGVQAVAPYMRRGGHHMIFSPDATFQPDDLHCPDSPVEAVPDGRDGILLSPDDRVEICRSQKDLTLYFAEPHDNQSIFCEKQREAGREKA